jgi:hypothetical protein
MGERESKADPASEADLDLLLLENAAAREIVEAALPIAERRPADDKVVPVVSEESESRPRFRFLRLLEEAAARSEASPPAHDGVVPVVSEARESRPSYRLLREMLIGRLAGLTAITVTLVVMPIVFSLYGGMPYTDALVVTARVVCLVLVAAGLVYLAVVFLETHYGKLFLVGLALILIAYWLFGPRR